MKIRQLQLLIFLHNVQPSLYQKQTNSSLEVLFFTINMSRKKLAWASKEVETFVCIFGEEDVVYDVLRSCRGDRHPAYHQGYCRQWKRDLGTELGFTAPSLPHLCDPIRSAPCSGNAALEACWIDQSPSLPSGL